MVKNKVYIVTLALLTMSAISCKMNKKTLDGDDLNRCLKQTPITIHAPRHSQPVALFTRLMSLWHNRVVILTKGSADITVLTDPSLPPEGYRIVCTNGKATVTGHDTRGVTYGLSALLTHYADNNGFADVDITDSPRLPFRGMHLYMPAREGVEGFKRIIDLMAFLRYNTVIIEVGGGMEYKNHPEINAGWENFCRNITEFPGNINGFTDKIRSHNSLHTELGGGSFLTQETVRSIVEHAWGYGLNVMPELQMLTHSYYITYSHPELAEIKDDFIPDTVCPSNEDAYQLYFALAEEILAVFEPKMVSIGHDELLAMGECDECKKYTGHELFAKEINRLHAFYKEKGVRIAMWCDKLKDEVSYYTGERIGGQEQHKRWGNFGNYRHIPATYEAIHLIPKDILLIDWEFSQNWESQKTAEELGFQQIFGNLVGHQVRGWERRLAYPSVIGGEISTWLLADEFTLGRGGNIAMLWYSAPMLWGNYDEDQHSTKYVPAMLKEMPMLRELLRDKQSAAVSMTNADAEVIYAADADQDYVLPTVTIPGRGIWAALKDQLPETLSGKSVGENNIIIPVNKKVKSLNFIHTCLGSGSFMPSYAMPVTEWYPLIYAIRYADGVTVHANVRYGVDIGIITADFDRYNVYKEPREENPDPPFCRPNHKWQYSLAYSAAPFLYGDGAAYHYEWENPRPDVTVERIFVVNLAKSKDEQAILFAVAAVL